jgi:nucleoside-diphosphate-sugar epimerase
MTPPGPNAPRALVTGANGFVGHHLCEHLLARGWRVRGSVRTGTAGAKLPRQVELVATGDLGPDGQWVAAVDGIDVVFHLAARVHVMRDSSADPLSAFRRVNVLGTERLARAAATAGVRRLVLVSSIKVNGEGRERPYREVDPPAPTDPYGVSKWEAEQVLARVAAETRVETVSVRPVLVYGEGMKANMERLFRTIDRGVPLPLAGIDNRRSLVYVGNLADFLVACAVAERVGSTYLLGDGEDLSTTQLAEGIGRALGRPARLFHVPAPVFRALGRISGRTAAVERLLGSLTVDSSRARADLAWSPPTTVAQGLARTAAWLRGGVTA